MKSRYIQQYFHVDGAFEIFKKARIPTTVFGSLNELDGFAQINSQDKHYITCHFENEIVPMEFPLPLDPPKKRLHANQVLKPIDRSNPIPHISVMFTNADQLTADKIS